MVVNSVLFDLFTVSWNQNVDAGDFLLYVVKILTYVNLSRGLHFSIFLAGVQNADFIQEECSVTSLYISFKKYWVFYLSAYQIRYLLWVVSAREVNEG
jgi:hypothetical protein